MLRLGLAQTYNSVIAAAAGQKRQQRGDGGHRLRLALALAGRLTGLGVVCGGALPIALLILAKSC
ncbi:MAG: hypothetical protein DU429_01630 [Candidatus Tokpelaia sp.]|nr:MAG: hypothetical protein DU430_03260 [Candidatus Tokpelaia sp.]KAA6207756.1 MAG: hypothetical protein DU429_01630 [Candidatus Tokpelaia sp.]KAA6404929.1 hypothetical protein DPQ22_08570 [Candidatus Tokpelaia sp.]